MFVNYCNKVSQPHSDIGSHGIQAIYITVYIPYDILHSSQNIHTHTACNITNT